MVSKERLVQLALPARKALQATLGSQVQQDKPETVARLVHQVQTVSLDRLASLELLELMELLVPMDDQDLLVQLDHWVSQVNRVTLAGLVPMVNLVQLGYVELLAHQDNRVKQVHLASRDLKALQVQQDSQGHQVHLDSQDCKVTLEPLAVQVQS